MSEEWNSLSASQKEPYNKQAEKDKVRYQNEMKTYSKKAPTGSESKKHKIVGKGQKAQKEESEQEEDEEENEEEEENDEVAE